MRFERSIRCLFAWYILFSFAASAYGSSENLDEMEVRKTRQTTAQWGPQYLENAAKFYQWQPETLCYLDVATGKEVWVLVRQPDRQDIISKEHGSNCWSSDGSRVGFFDFGTRGTSNPAISSGNGRGSRRWIVKTDGSGLRATEGYGNYTIPFSDFGWGHTELAYYAFGSHSYLDGPVSSLYKMSIDENNVISGKFILDTSTVNTNLKDLVKDGVSTNDKWIVARDYIYRITGSPNNINTSEIYFISLDGTPNIVRHWGVARGCGPLSDPYGDHELANESRFHDVWSPGLNGDHIMGQYSGGTFWVLKRDGSYTDGGPVFAEWDGSQFGENEEIRCVSNGAGTPNNPYGTPYFGHPVFDRWGRYGLVGTYTDSPSPGTRIWDSASDKFLSNYPLAYKKYDGQHHSWTGWSDYVLGVDPIDLYIYANKWNADAGDSSKVVNTHYPGYSGNYNGYPRPSQSPDGTKVVFAATWLNNSGDAYPYISWAVVYYPHAPRITGASTYGSVVRLSWTFDNASKYTTRGWPNEDADTPPDPREIKCYHVWASEDRMTWRELTTSGVPFGTNQYDASQPLGSTWYYAVTSEEYSRLESRTLSNVWKVTLNGDGKMDTNAQQTEYPADPGGISAFWTTAPPAPTKLAVTKQTVAGQYRLNWTEPDDSKIRYYNIYYSTVSTPPADRQYRIASVPVGTSSYLDWLADPTAQGYYRITSVDRQGNESADTTVTPPTGIHVVE